ncbi:hypothetical protein WJX72_007425 [[Myrmecia] bisecta]|uniref:Dolichyl-diphosphooligosaccharide--protein glycosyltransferase subunit 1 n=1 Tax=[Myrmecia] bisecta TaxID=41462 RepID=A0AAW1PXK1_9CHLO
MSVLKGRTIKLLLGLLLAAVLSTGSAELVLQKVDREIKLHSHLTILTDTLSVKNTGKESIADVVFCFPQRHAQQLAFAEVSTGQDDDAPALKVAPATETGAPANVTCSKATLPQPLKAGASVDLEVYAVFTKLQTPYPASITQQDPQRVLYHDNIYVLSPYQIAKQTTKVRLPSRKVESFTKHDPSNLAGTVLTYGPYTDVAPFTQAAMRLHFENNTPFAEVISLVREIELSHWGNVYVEETYSVFHAGAKHKGEWSRLDYMKEPSKYAASSFRTLSLELPKEANTLYFRDEIGNVSTSNVRRLRDRVQVELSPRFPLVGGWRVDFVFGYSLPLSSVAERLPGGRIKLRSMFTTPIEGVFVDDLTVKVILPEGASDIDVQVPFKVNKSSEKKYSYLDTGGRPVVVLHKTNVVPDHNQVFETSYTFSRLVMLREPLLIVTAFLLMFATAIIYVRCEFTIARDDKWQVAQDVERAGGLVQRMARIFAERRNILDGLEYVSSTGGTADIASAKASSEKRLQSTAEQLQKLGQDLEMLAGKRGSLVRDILEKERQLQAAALALVVRRVQLRGEQPGLSEADILQRLAPPRKAVEDLRKEAQHLTGELQTAF